MAEKHKVVGTYVSLKCLSERTGLSYDNLRHRVLKGELPGLRRLGRRLFVSIDEFDAACREAAQSK